MIKFLILAAAVLIVSPGEASDRFLKVRSKTVRTFYKMNSGSSRNRTSLNLPTKVFYNIGSLGEENAAKEKLNALLSEASSQEFVNLQKFCDGTNAEVTSATTIRVVAKDAKTGKRILKDLGKVVMWVTCIGFPGI